MSASANAASGSAACAGDSDGFASLHSTCSPTSPPISHSPEPKSLPRAPIDVKRPSPSTARPIRPATCPSPIRDQPMSQFLTPPMLASRFTRSHSHAVQAGHARAFQSRGKPHPCGNDASGAVETSSVPANAADACRLARMPARDTSRRSAGARMGHTWRMPTPADFLPTERHGGRQRAFRSDPAGSGWGIPVARCGWSPTNTSDRKERPHARL